MSTTDLNSLHFPINWSFLFFCFLQSLQEEIKPVGFKNGSETEIPVGWYYTAFSSKCTVTNVPVSDTVVLSRSMRMSCFCCSLSLIQYIQLFLVSDHHYGKLNSVAKDMVNGKDCSCSLHPEIDDLTLISILYSEVSHKGV